MNKATLARRATKLTPWEFSLLLGLPSETPVHIEEGRMGGGRTVADALYDLIIADPRRYIRVLLDGRIKCARSIAEHEALNALTVKLHELQMV
jgi:hypothetical protein